MPLASWHPLRLPPATAALFSLDVALSTCLDKRCDISVKTPLALHGLSPCQFLYLFACNCADFRALQTRRASERRRLATARAPVPGDLPFNLTTRHNTTASATCCRGTRCGFTCARPHFHSPHTTHTTHTHLSHTCHTTPTLPCTGALGTLGGGTDAIPWSLPPPPTLTTTYLPHGTHTHHPHRCAFCAHAPTPAPLPPPPHPHALPHPHPPPPPPPPHTTRHQPIACGPARARLRPGGTWANRRWW